MKPYTELRQIAEAATPGPWRDCASCIEGALPAKGEAATVCVTPNPHARSGTKPGEKWRKDRAFIATFDPPTVLALLDRLAEVERELEGARAGAETPSLKRLLRASEIQQARAALDVIESYALGRGDDEGARSYANCIRKILAAELSSLRAPSEAASPESLGVSQDEPAPSDPSTAWRGTESSSNASTSPLAATRHSPDETLNLLDRKAAETHCRMLWGGRQDDCAKYGADISMPTVEVRVDELADLLRGAEEALKTVEGLGRLGELVTAFVDPSGVLNVAGLKDRILALEASAVSAPDPFDPMRPNPCPAGGSCKVIGKCPSCRLPGARRTALELEQGIPARNVTPDAEAVRGKLINALYREVIHQQPEAVFRGQYGVLEIGEVKINCCALAHEVLRAFKEAAEGAS